MRDYVFLIIIYVLFLFVFFACMQFLVIPHLYPYPIPLQNFFVIVTEQISKVITGKFQHVNHERNYFKTKKLHISPLRNQLGLDVERDTLTV